VAKTATRNVGKAEFMCLLNQYNAENLCQTKFQYYAQQVEDPQLRNMLENFSNQCQQRTSRLASMLQECGGGNYIST